MAATKSSQLIAKLSTGVGRLTLGKDGHTMYLEYDISSNAEALVAVLLVCALVVVAFV
jgi:hypothetical protein